MKTFETHFEDCPWISIRDRFVMFASVSVAILVNLPANKDRNSQQ